MDREEVKHNLSKLTMWANVYEATNGQHYGYLHASEERARGIAQDNAIATAVPVTIKYPSDK